MTTTVHSPAAPSDQSQLDQPDAAGHASRERLLQGPRTGRRWLERLPLAGLLVATALLYLVGLSKSGWANQFYAAAVQSGTKSWKAFLFGSLDPSNFITVDKPPASLWVMELSARVFGLNSWSLLVPQALEGVAAVWLLYLAVRRVSGPSAGLLAGAALASTPVAALMFRYDNPDALLVLLMTAAAYATVRAIQGGRLRWLLGAGALLGFAFLTKMLQGFIVAPAFGAAYLTAGGHRLRARVWHALAAFAAMLVAAGWWVALVTLRPAASRPYVGGSNHDSVLELIFGYNGIGRLDGSSNNGNVSGGTGGFSSGETGLTRLFGAEMGTQISWLLPAALVAIGALAWLSWRRSRTDALRASLIVWGGWLVVNGLVFSYASGIIHPYYTVALAPPIAALVGIGVVELSRARGRAGARWVLATLVASGAWWSYELLGRSDWHPELRWIVLVAGVVAVTCVLLARMRALLLAPVVAVTLLIAPTAYAVQTASSAHTGAIPSAGPSASGGGFGGGGFGGGAGGGRGFGGGQSSGQGGSGRPGSSNGTTASKGTTGGPGGGFPGSTGGPSTGGTSTGGTSTGGTSTGGSSSGSAGSMSGRPGGGFGGGRGSGGGGQGGGAMGGLGGATSVSSALVKALTSGSYEWAAATTDSNEAASLELASGTSVMALGGYNGTDPAISLSAFEKLVVADKVHYYVADSSGFIGSTAADTSTAYAIQQWVEKNYTATTIGTSTVYDLTVTK